MSSTTDLAHTQPQGNQEIEKTGSKSRITQPPRGNLQTKNVDPSVKSEDPPNVTRIRHKLAVKQGPYLQSKLSSEEKPVEETQKTEGSETKAPAETKPVEEGQKEKTQTTESAEHGEKPLQAETKTVPSQEKQKGEETQAEEHPTTGDTLSATDKQIITDEKELVKREGFDPLSSDNKIHLLLNRTHHQEFFSLLTNLRGVSEDVENSLQNLRRQLRDLFGKHRVFSYKQKESNIRYLLVIAQCPLFFDLKFVEHKTRWECLIGGLLSNVIIESMVGLEIGIGIRATRKKEKDIIASNEMMVLCDQQQIDIVPLQKTENLKVKALQKAMKKHRSDRFFKIQKLRRVKKKRAEDSEAVGVFVIIYYSHDESGTKEMVSCTEPMHYNEKRKDQKITLQIPMTQKRDWSCQVLFMDSNTKEWKISMQYPLYPINDYLQLVDPKGQ